MLEQRRLRGDLIEMFKIIKGFDNVDRKQFFTLASDDPQHYDIRGHVYRIVPPHAHTTRRKSFFDIRTIHTWNKLPVYVIACNTVDNFKIKLDLYFKR